MYKKKIQHYRLDRRSSNKKEEKNNTKKETTINDNVSLSLASLSRLLLLMCGNVLTNYSYSCSLILFIIYCSFVFLFQSDDERETEQGRKDQRKYQSPPHGIETTYASTSVSTALQYETIVSLTSERRRQQRPFLFDFIRRCVHHKS